MPCRCCWWATRPWGNFGVLFRDIFQKKVSKKYQRISWRSCQNKWKKCSVAISHILSQIQFGIFKRNTSGNSFRIVFRNPFDKSFGNDSGSWEVSVVILIDFIFFLFFKQFRNYPAAILKGIPSTMYWRIAPMIPWRSPQDITGEVS